MPPHLCQSLPNCFSKGSEVNNPNITYESWFFYMKCFAKLTKPLHVGNPLEVSFANDSHVLQYLGAFFWQFKPIPSAALNFHIQQTLLQILKDFGISNYHIDHGHLQSSKIPKSSLRMIGFHIYQEFLDDFIMKIVCF